MRILFLTETLPYPVVTRARIRAYYMLRHLAQQHQVTLASFSSEGTRPESVAHLGQFCQVVHTVPNPQHLANSRTRLRHLLAGQPLSLVHNQRAAMEALVTRLMSERGFDAIHADQTAMAHYALAARKAHSTGPIPQMSLDLHRAMHLLVGLKAGYEPNGLYRALWRQEAGRLARYEANFPRQFDHIFTMTANDKGALLHLVPEAETELAGSRIHVLPLGVDPAGTPMLPHEEAGPHILFLGDFAWPPSSEGVLWFTQHVLPQILYHVPDVHLTIAGRNPPPAVQALAAPRSPVAGSVEVTGFVVDPTPLLARSRVFIVPLQVSEGMQAKVLDAWLRGVPVVTTRMGAAGINIRPGQTNLLADDPAEFAAATVALLTQPDMASGIAQNARHWVSQQYDWQLLYRELDGIFVGGLER